MVTSFRFLAVLVLISGSFSACKKSQNNIDFHHDYFGQEEGRYIIYDVVEIIHDDALQQHDTLTYQLKTHWADTFVDNQGRVAREYWRYRRDSVTGSWDFIDIWSGLIDGPRAEMIEDNQRIVRLIFSPTTEKEWDANAYNPTEERIYYYRDIHRDTIVGGISFDSTLVVEQAYDKPNLINYDRKYEVYANNIGLVYRHWRTINTQYNPNPYINYGYELYYTFAETGFE